MGRHDPKRGQPGNPGQFAKDTRGKTMLPQPSRLSRAYHNEGAPPNRVSEAVEGYRTMHAVAGTSMAAYRATEETAGVLHEMWRENRRQPDGSFEPRWKDNGAGGQVDIANTPYEDLPEKWKAENRASADSAVQAILADPDADMETLASEVHDQWLARNGEWAPPEQNRPYAELPEEEKEKDRVVVREALSSLSFGDGLPQD